MVHGILVLGFLTPLVGPLWGGHHSEGKTRFTQAFVVTISENRGITVVSIQLYAHCT